MQTSTTKNDKGLANVGPLGLWDVNPDAGVILHRGSRYLGGGNPRWKLTWALAARVNEGLVALTDAMKIMDGIDAGTVTALPAHN